MDAETAGTQVENIVEAANADAASQIAAAETRAEAAEETAAQITEAAFRSELGQRVTAVEEDLTEWQESIERVESQVTQQAVLITSLQTTIAALELRLSSLTAAPAQPLTPQPSPGEKVETSETLETTITPIPAEPANPNGADADGQKVLAPRANRFRLT